MKIAEVLKQTKALIAEPENHVKGYFALDANSNEVSPINPVACKFCAVGALRRITGVATSLRTDMNTEYTKARDLLWKAVISESDSSYSTTLFNDERSHEDVMKVFDIAIKKAEDENI